MTARCARRNGSNDTCSAAERFIMISSAFNYGVGHSISSNSDHTQYTQHLLGLETCTTYQSAKHVLRICSPLQPAFCPIASLFPELGRYNATDQSPLKLGLLCQHGRPTVLHSMISQEDMIYTCWFLIRTLYIPPRMMDDSHVYSQIYKDVHLFHQMEMHDPLHHDIIV